MQVFIKLKQLIQYFMFFIGGLMFQKHRISIIVFITLSLLISAPFSGISPATSGKASAATATTAQNSSKSSVQTGIVKINGFYYYRQHSDKVIRTKPGFIKVDGELYYVQKGGKFATGNFQVGNKRYKAWSNGKVARGVYKGVKNYWYSDPRTGEWIQKQGFVRWNGKSYYLQKGGAIIVNRPFVSANIPYIANAKGESSRLPIIKPGNKVLKTAQSQVGVMTGRKYWRWYFGTKFRDTDRTPWCACFVAWCYNQGGQYKRISPVRRYGNLGYVPSYTRYVRSRGKWVNRSKAKGGDLIIFGKSSGRHIGIVERVYKGYVFTIEGNSGPTAAYGCGKPGAVTRRVYKLDDKDIIGIAHVL